MKKIILLLLLVVSVNAAISSFQEVKASVLKYEPGPAEQGRTVDVWLQFSNPGTQADRVKVKLESEFPFSLPAGQVEEVDVGFIAATGDKVQKYTVYVDPNAPTGDHIITFWYQFGGSTDWVKLESSISVSSQNAVLVIDEYKVSPSPIVPGQSAVVTMRLRNAGSIGVRDVDVSLDLEDSFTTVGTGAKQRVDFVRAGGVVDVSFTIASDTDTVVKLYALPVVLSFTDERGKSYSDSAKVSVVVNAVPELSVSVDSTDFADKKSVGTVSLKIVNKGVVDLKYVNVVLVQTPDYEVLSSSNEQYVGNLDNDDFETVDFLIKPLVSDPRLSVKLEFKDPYNVDFTRSFDLPLRIITDKDLGKGSSGFGWIVLLLVIAGGWYYFRRKKARK